MEYTQGTLGRVFVARLHEGDSLYDAVHAIAEREDLHAAAVMAVGGMRRAKVVTGPEDPAATKIVPHFEEFDDAREIVGFGTLFRQEGAPALHFHAGIGRGDSALVGCPRGGMSVFLIQEVVILELLGLDAAREFDPAYGVHLLKLMNPR